MYTRFIEFYRFDLSGDSIHILNYIVSGSLDLDHPAVLFLADRQDIRRIGSRHDSQAVSAMDGFNMITAHNNRKLFTFIDKGGRMLVLVARPIGIQQIDRTAVRMIPNRETD